MPLCRLRVLPALAALRSIRRRARELARPSCPTVERVGLFVDPTDAELEAVLRHVPLDILQLHGDETPERVTRRSPSARAAGS